MRFSSTILTTVPLLHERAAQLDAEIAWLLKSVSDRLENIYFPNWASVFLSESGFLAGFNAGEVATLVALFRLFCSIFGRHVPKRKRSESKPPLFQMALYIKWLLCIIYPRDTALFNVTAHRNWLEQTGLTQFFCSLHLSFLVWELLRSELSKQNLAYIH